MIVHVGNKMDSLIAKKNFYELFSFIISVTVPSHQKTLLKDYKRIHVNDALRSIGEIWFWKSIGISINRKVCTTINRLNTPRT